MAGLGKIDTMESTHHRIILRDAHLASIQSLAPQKASSCKPDIGIFGDNGRVTTTKFQRHWCQRFRGFLCYDGANRSTPSVEDLVPFLFQKLGGFSHTALHDCKARRVQGTFDDLLQDDCYLRCILAGFEDSCIAGCDGADERPNCKVDWKVVRSGLLLALGARAPIIYIPNDKHASKRVLPYPWAHE